MLRVHWQSHLFEFGVEVKGRYTPQAIEQAVYMATHYSNMATHYSNEYGKQQRAYPMIIVPYLHESALARLEEQSVSGIDLCGNGIIIVPDKLLVLRTGFPNQYPSSEPLKNIYRGNSSLVARAFLAQATYSSVNNLHLFIKERGGNLALSTVSKALSVLESDLLVGRSSGTIRLLQPDKLLEKLAGSYEPPRINRKLQARYLADSTSVMEILVSNAEANHARYVLTGTSSINLYATMAKPDVLSLYCTDIDAMLSESGVQPAPIEETTRFVDIEQEYIEQKRVRIDKGRRVLRVKPGQEGVHLHAHLAVEAIGIEANLIPATITGQTSAGKEYESVVFLPQSLTYLVMKLCAFYDREFERQDGQNAIKHAFDLYPIVAMMTREEYKTVHQMRREFQTEAAFLRATEIVRMHFSGVEDLGVLRLREHPDFSTSFDLKEFLSVLSDIFLRL